MRILLTNDDGVEAPGLMAMRDRLLERVSVVTIAPRHNCSGLARACTFNRPVDVRLIQPGSDPVYVVDGTPSDCVRAGLLGGFVPKVDLVVSGINHGANLADDVRYSGTIAAGLEAADFNVSAVCVSQQNPAGSFAVNHREDLKDNGTYDFGDSALFAAEFASCVVVAQPAQPMVLSVNVPARNKSVGWVVTHPAHRNYPRGGQLTDRSRHRFLFHAFGRPEEEIPEFQDDGQTDVAALRAGMISVSLIGAFSRASLLSEPHRAFFQRLSSLTGGSSLDLEILSRASLRIEGLLQGVGESAADEQHG